MRKKMVWEIQSTDSSDLDTKNTLCHLKQRQPFDSQWCFTESQLSRVCIVYLMSSVMFLRQLPTK